MVRFQNSRAATDFEALYSAGAEDVLQWIRSLLRQGGAQLDPSELLQDTFVNVYRYPSGFRPEHAGSFRVWVRTIAGNAVRRARRRAAPRASALEEQTSEPCDPGASPLLLAHGREQALVFARSLSLLYAAILFAFERLRPRDRRALELVELQGQPYAEAGPLLGVPPENMKMIVFRARRRLLLEIGAALSG
jgi:RNA polymerase sigma factor (sigma-70 family)